MIPLSQVLIPDPAASTKTQHVFAHTVGQNAEPA